MRRAALAAGAAALAAALAPSALGAPPGVIAFDRALDGTGRIEVVAADGTGLRTVGPASGATRPAWSADGARLVFTVGDVVASELWTASPDGGAAARLTRGPGVHDLADPSPRGARVAYAATPPDGTPEVWTIGAGGAVPRRLARGATLPRWSPDGRRLAAIDPAAAALEVIGPGGGRPVTVGRLRVAAGPSPPSWSPDGRRLAVVDARGRLAVVDLHGGGARRLTAGTGPAGAAFPAWSPAGGAIAVVLGPRDDLALVPPGGGRPRRVGRTDGGSGAAWSPDGRYLAFADAAHHLAVVRADGRGLRELTSGATTDAHPVWRPTPGPG